MSEDMGDEKPLTERWVWGWDVEKVLQSYETSLEKGLSSEKVEAAREVYGFNELDTPPKKPFWKLVLEQFEDTLVR